MAAPTRCQRPLPAYGSSMRRDIGPADEAARLARLRDRLGCRAFKIRTGQRPGPVAPDDRDARRGLVQLDICYVGGLTRAWRVAKMAEAAIGDTPTGCSKR